MKLNGTFMMQKLNNYVKFESEKTPFMQRFAMDLIFGKALKSKSTVVESFIIVKLLQENRVYSELLQAAIAAFLGSNSECDLGAQVKFAEIVSYVVVNWPTGKDEMTDIGPWDWSKFLSVALETPEREAKFNVLMRLVAQKLELLSSGYCFPAEMKKFAPSEELKSPTKFKAVEELEKLELMQELLGKKAGSEELLPLIVSETDYEIFLEALFERTSQSHTHLEVLTGRYEGVFRAHKQEHDWTLINTIRSFWSRSLFHRLLYLDAVIERGFVDFESYVKYIGKVETAGEEEALEVKIELN
jgi:hypothetical protein